MGKDSSDGGSGLLTAAGLTAFCCVFNAFLPMVPIIWGGYAIKGINKVIKEQKVHNAYEEYHLKPMQARMTAEATIMANIREAQYERAMKNYEEDKRLQELKEKYPGTTGAWPEALRYRGYQYMFDAIDSGEPYVISRKAYVEEKKIVILKWEDVLNERKKSNGDKNQE